MFSHDFDVPKVFELCKFYVYDRCVKKDKCLYLHKEFPCKFYHLGIDVEHSDEACKFSHQPLNDLSRNLLLKVSFFLVKGTVSVISSYSPWKNGDARFTTVPLKALSDQA